MQEFSYGNISTRILHSCSRLYFPT
uniref:Uncharacterized protein n=1 Tax=Arundo donax TaxID=35708 RepID=A0A0A8Y640_ARUDO